MMEADMGMTQQAMNDHDRFRGDEHLYVKFFKHPLQDREETLAQGRPIFKEVEFIQIMVPGDKGNIIMREIRPQDKQRFAKQYQAFNSQEQEFVSGTPLEKWHFMTSAQVEEMKYFNIRTVEQLAGVSDSNAQKFMGINALKRKAQEYLDASKEEAPVLMLQEELSQRDATIEELKSLVADLSSRVEASEKKGKSKKD